MDKQEEERRQGAFNATAADYPFDKTLVQALRGTGAGHSGRDGAGLGERRVSYDELNSRPIDWGIL